MNTHLGKCWHNFTILELESDVAQKKKKQELESCLFGNLEYYWGQNCNHLQIKFDFFFV